jgi:hypothetical protein
VIQPQPSTFCGVSGNRKPEGMPPFERPAAANTGDPNRDRKYQQQQLKMITKQEQDRQKLQRKQDQEHQRLTQQNASEARQQQVEQRHQQQTQQLQQRHVQQQQRLQEKQPPRQKLSADLGLPANAKVAGMNVKSLPWAVNTR